MTTPAQRGASNRRRGHQAERDLCRWLRVNGFGHAERAVRAGFRTADRTSADPGDVTGCPGLVISVKDAAVERTEAWLAELWAMGGDDTALRLLCHKRRGHADPGRWWCWLQIHDLGRLLTDADPDVPLSEWALPVRMELGHVVRLLRAAGYGDPEVAA